MAVFRLYLNSIRKVGLLSLKSSVVGIVVYCRSLSWDKTLADPQSREKAASALGLRY